LLLATHDAEEGGGTDRRARLASDRERRGGIGGCQARRLGRPKKKGGRGGASRPAGRRAGRLGCLGQQAEMEEGRVKMKILLFFFQSEFPNSFSNDF
jgi:hypothetical protein